ARSDCRMFSRKPAGASVAANCLATNFFVHHIASYSRRHSAQVSTCRSTSAHVSASSRPSSQSCSSSLKCRCGVGISGALRFDETHPPGGVTAFNKEATARGEQPRTEKGGGAVQNGRGVFLT